MTKVDVKPLCRECTRVRNHSTLQTYKGTFESMTGRKMTCGASRNGPHK